MSDAPPEDPDLPADAPASEPIELVTPAEPTGLALVVERWFNAHIAAAPVPHSVEAVNYLHSKLPDLIAAIEKKD